MIVKNEEQVLERCLSSVMGIVDEIIIVDTGSNDRTKEIASQFTDHIHDFIWVNDFSAARNFAFQQATQEYILWLDADDILLEEDADKFRQLKNHLPSDTDAVSMIYNLAFDEHGNVTSSLRRNRLVKRTNNFKWIGVVHEYLEVYGNIHNAEISITHDRKHTQSSRNLHIYENKEAAGLPFSSRDLYYYANELLDHGLWERSLYQYERFLERGDGWVEDVISAYGKAGDCLHSLGRTLEAKAKVLQAFAHTLPRAENCCRLGYYHMEEANYEDAVYWYKTAAALVRPQNTQAILNHACWSWLPHLQLCVCYNKLGLNSLAHEHNELAAVYIPNDQRILSNRSYFQSLNLIAATPG
ncbi:glycosyltransferase family 2 protein [Paenibacillus sp. N5-1-1-5]|uniref:Glycosyltransferase family 2 protein n=2 Tax=Paenibacillus radicis (ex Xue et al. 2023) TaxID=2972489 RepID=A0ABT1YJ58_9BACL|nr:glycosyltransferase family 2 protein [Paenibacillus radicis (ex Xue et al. 2023)]